MVLHLKAAQENSLHWHFEMAVKSSFDLFLLGKEMTIPEIVYLKK